MNGTTDIATLVLDGRFQHHEQPIDDLRLEQLQLFSRQHLQRHRRRLPEDRATDSGPEGDPMMSFLIDKGKDRKSADRRGRRRTDSSTIAIGTATLVVVLGAVVGLALDRPLPTPDPVGAGWHLRGALGAAAPRNGRV